MCLWHRQSGDVAPLTIYRTRKLVKDEFIVYKLFLMVGSKAGYAWAYYVVKPSARFITSYPDTDDEKIHR